MKKNWYKTAKQSCILFSANAVLVASVSIAFAADTTVVLANPLKVKTIGDLLVAIINIVMILMVPVIVFFIIYSGFKYVVARGNASQVEEASQSLFYAILGGVLILGAFAIANIIQSIVTAFQNTPTP